MSQPEQPGFGIPGRGRQPFLPRSEAELQGLVEDLRGRLAEAERALDALRRRPAPAGTDRPGAAPSREPPACVQTEAGQRAQALQDNLIQTLFGIGMGLEECKHLIEEDRPAAITTVDRAIAGLNALIRDVRTRMLAGPAEENPRE